MRHLELRLLKRPLKQGAYIKPGDRLANGFLHLPEIPPPLIRTSLADIGLEFLDLELDDRVIDVAISMVLSQKVECLLLLAMHVVPSRALRQEPDS